jgi:CRP-like cAMP-binding protein
MSLDRTIAQLSRTRPFDALPRAALQLVAFSAEERKLAAGEMLFEQGDVADAGYFVLSGAITLSARGEGKERTHVARADALIGEAALLTELKRSASARVTENARVLRITRSVFQRVLGEFPIEAAVLRARIAARTKALAKEYLVAWRDKGR